MSAKEEYLETLFKIEEQNAIIMGAVAILKADGVEGIKDLAEQEPQLLLESIVTLADLAQVNHNAHKNAAEMYLILLDEIEKVARPS